MPDYRRAFQPGGTFFFTVVTYQRAPFLCDGSARRIFRQAITECQSKAPFDINAFVLLPDHLHAVWTLPQDDADFGRRWGMIKKAFTTAWRDSGGREGDVSKSKRRDRRRGAWQRRFWEHSIRDQADFNRHLDYIHYNPVKHGLASCPHAWPYSSFHRFADKGIYQRDWCCGCDGRKVVALQFGELDDAQNENPFGE